MSSPFKSFLWSKVICTNKASLGVHTQFPISIEMIFLFTKLSTYYFITERKRDDSIISPTWKWMWAPICEFNKLFTYSSHDKSVKQNFMNAINTPTGINITIEIGIQVCNSTFCTSIYYILHHVSLSCILQTFCRPFKLCELSNWCLLKIISFLWNDTQMI